MNIYVATQVGTDISSRSRGRLLREKILAENEPCEFNFKGVRSVSHSFADECFAILVVEKGETWFRNNIKLVECHETIRQTILEAILRRLECLTT